MLKKKIVTLIKFKKKSFSTEDSKLNVKLKTH